MSTLNTHVPVLSRKMKEKKIPKLLPFAFRSGVLINPQWLELTIS